MEIVIWDSYFIGVTNSKFYKEFHTLISMKDLDYKAVIERVEMNLPGNDSIVERTFGTCEWIGKYESCGPCDGKELNCYDFLGKNYSE